MGRKELGSALETSDERRLHRHERVKRRRRRRVSYKGKKKSVQERAYALVNHMPHKKRMNNGYKEERENDFLIQPG